MPNVLIFTPGSGILAYEKFPLPERNSVYTSPEDAALHEAVMDLFEVHVTRVGQAHGREKFEFGYAIEVPVSETLKRELVEALDLGINAEDNEVQEVVLLVSSVRRPSAEVDRLIDEAQARIAS